MVLHGIATGMKSVNNQAFAAVSANSYHGLSCYLFTLLPILCSCWTSVGVVIVLNEFPYQMVRKFICHIDVPLPCYIINEWYQAG